MKRASLIVLITLAGLLVIALPTALFFGLGDLVLGGDASNALFTVGFMAAGLALLWAAQFACSSWRESRAQRRRD
ncbi:hypothetical protein GY12_04850 [Micrococcus luteus]|nr:hypothetical protein GY12_04850 [Micrococcus luteus]